MVTIRYAAGLVAVVCWVIVLITLTVDAVAILGTVAVAVWLWTFGVFTWAFWFGDAETSARLAVVDEQIDFAESVEADIASINGEGNPRL